MVKDQVKQTEGYEDNLFNDSSDTDAKDLFDKTPDRKEKSDDIPDRKEKLKKIKENNKKISDLTKKIKTLESKKDGIDYSSTIEDMEGEISHLKREQNQLNYEIYGRNVLNKSLYENTNGNNDEIIIILIKLDDELKKYENKLESLTNEEYQKQVVNNEEYQKTLSKYKKHIRMLGFFPEGEEFDEDKFDFIQKVNSTTRRKENSLTSYTIDSIKEKNIMKEIDGYTYKGLEGLGIKKLSNGEYKLDGSLRKILYKFGPKTDKYNIPHLDVFYGQDNDNIFKMLNDLEDDNQIITDWIEKFNPYGPAFVTGGNEYKVNVIHNKDGYNISFDFVGEDQNPIIDGSALRLGAYTGFIEIDENGEVNTNKDKLDDLMKVFAFLSIMEFKKYKEHY